MISAESPVLPVVNQYIEWMEKLKSRFLAEELTIYETLSAAFTLTRSLEDALGFLGETEYMAEMLEK